MNNWQWKKKTALAEQLKFFGAKKKKFISVYAKKPRILVKVKSASIKCNDSNRDYLIGQGNAALLANMQGNQLRDLYQQQMQMGALHSAFGVNQMTAAQALGFALGSGPATSRGVFY